ncbi:hypothetical protein [Nitrincola sp. MINF-07-Sa-05]|uniref:hypothetical protein n=1 Tax=Nitrincola salilacus TaxID=3400273 RepID=UPI0039182B66
MSWEIVSNSTTARYNLGEDSYQTETIKLVSKKFHSEPGDYKEPEDTVCIATFQADSLHGMFSWKVSARRSGFEINPAIEEVFETTIPDPSIEVDEPAFDILEKE